jgi:hypothetical protein
MPNDFSAIPVRPNGGNCTHSWFNSIRTALVKYFAGSLTTTERDALVSPADGMILYNSTTGRINFRANGAWTESPTPGASAKGARYSSDGAGGVYWAEEEGRDDAFNYTVTCSVNSGALTINVNKKRSSSPIAVSFRSASNDSGGLDRGYSTSNLSIVLPSGATLGMANGVTQDLYLFAMLNGSSIELAVCGCHILEPGQIASTTAISSGSTNGHSIYSTAARSNMPMRLLARLRVTTPTAGTWVHPDVIDVRATRAPVEYRNADSASGQAPSNTGATAQYVSLTGNSLVLTPGMWQLAGLSYFSNSGGAVGYVDVISQWGSTNGSNSISSPPALVTAVANTYGLHQFRPGTGVDAMIVPAPTCRVQITSTSAVYLVPYINCTTPANARLSSRLWAERIA